jgi:pimeloyl-ACP methyl ester carboxylesterase
VVTFALIHGAGDVGWSWHLVAAELEAHGHDVVAPDLPCEDESAGLAETTQSVLDALAAAGAEASTGHEELVVVGHSLGGMIAPLVAERSAENAQVRLIYLAAMVPAPGERPGDWWESTGYAAAARAEAERDGGLTGNEDPFVSFCNGVPRALAEEAMSRSRGQSARSMEDPWPLERYPQVPTRVLVCRDDRFFPVEFLRRVAGERLGLEAEVIPGCHCVALSHPRELAAALMDPVAGQLPSG